MREREEGGIQRQIQLLLHLLPCRTERRSVSIGKNLTTLRLNLLQNQAKVKAAFEEKLHRGNEGQFGSIC